MNIQIASYEDYLVYKKYCQNKRYLAKKASEDLRFRDSLAKKIARRSGYSRDKAHRFTKAHGFAREADELNNSNALSAFNSSIMNEN